jgi:hypothetical protein
MRRPLLVLLLVLAAIPATAASAAESPIRRPEFTLHADGFLVRLRSETDSSKVVLTLYRHGQTAYYETTARITEDSVEARFGKLGELDYTFAPAAGKEPRCKGADGTREGTFQGTFDFTGENRYVTIDADRAHGSFELFPAAGCEEQSAGQARATPSRRARSAGPGGRGQAEAKGEVTLQAAAGGRRRADYLLAFTMATKRGVKLFINGFRAEKLEGMLVERGVQTAAPPSALRWDRAAGVARLTPPAPFRGSAELRRRPHGRPIWRGSLTVPILGGSPVRLTGRRFRASIGPGSLTD